MQKVWVFGTGKVYKDREKYIKSHFEVAGYLDNKAMPGQAVHYGGLFPVYHPAGGQYLEDDYPIILMSGSYVEMWHQLSAKGVDGRRILFGIMLCPFSEREKILAGNGYLSIENKDIIYSYNKNGREVIHEQKDAEKIANALLREKYRSEDPFISAVAGMPVKPSGRVFGLDRGSAIDRYYIESFLEANKQLIQGVCLEIAEDTYTKRYGEGRIKKSEMLHVEGWGNGVIRGNLATGEGIMADSYDCAIITQTLMFIFDIQSAARNIYKLLKRNGTALITVSGISQVSRYDADNWGSFYGFHEDAVRKLFEPLFGEKNVQVETYGNVKTAIAMLYGMCCEDLKTEDFKETDKDYPVIIAAVLRKE